MSELRDPSIRSCKGGEPEDACGRQGLLQPGRQHRLDIATPTRALEATEAICEDDEGRHLVDAEALRKVGPRLDIDLAEDKGAVVLPPLEHLCDEAFDAAASTVHLRAEQDEKRACPSSVCEGADSLGAELLTRVQDPRAIGCRGRARHQRACLVQRH